MTVRLSNILYLLLTLSVFVGGYIYLRYAYHVTDSTPFTQEIILIVLSVVATVLITALLLNKQTEVELRKEQSIKFIELKSDIYLEFFSFVQDLLTRGRVEESDLLKLRFFSHKLAIIASPEVLKRHHDLLQIIDQSGADHALSETEGDDIHRSLSKLTLAIRDDLIGEVDDQLPWEIQDIHQQILKNTDTLLDD